MSNKLAFARLVAQGLTVIGVGRVIQGAVKATVTPQSLPDQVMVWIGSYALASMFADYAGEHIDNQVVSGINMFERIRAIKAEADKKEASSDEETKAEAP